MSGGLLRPILVLFFAALFFVWTAQDAMSRRNQVRELTQHLDALQGQSRALQDEQRSVLLEYMTITGYVELRDAAAQLGMLEPDSDDDSLMFVSRGKQQ